MVNTSNQLHVVLEKKHAKVNAIQAKHNLRELHEACKTFKSIQKKPDGFADKEIYQLCGKSNIFQKYTKAMKNVESALEQLNKGLVRM